MDDTIIVLAVGGAGCRILAKMHDMPEAAMLRLMAIDTDRHALKSTMLPPEDTLLAAESWRNGRGCGGNVLDGQRSIAHERNAISAMLKGASMLVVTGGLGGGTASGGIPIVLSEAAKLHVPTFCILSMPFMMEGVHRITQAEKALHDNVFPAADAVATLPNDLLFSSSLDDRTPLADAFLLADREMARTIVALTGILTAGNLFSTSFSDLAALLKKGRGRCSIGIGVAREDVPETERVDCALEKLLLSPMLGGAKQLAEADAVIFTALGGPELSLKDAKTALDIAKKYVPESAELVTGAATSDAWKGLFQLSALAIRFDTRDEERSLLGENKKLFPGGAGNADRRTGAVQGVFAFDDNNKGVMEGTLSVCWNSENLDIPAYKRRNLVVSRGKMIRKK